jgi:hypothetical protein
MSVEYYMSVDPGKATGVAIGRVTDSEALEVIYTAIVPGGTKGFIDWLEMTNNGKYITEFDCMKNYPGQYDSLDYHLDVVCETFQLRGGSFTPDLEPLRIEGVLMDRFGSVMHWQQPSDKKIVGDKFLKDNDLWRTGKDVGHIDGRDANDALLHLFSAVLKSKHMPSLQTYWR